MSNNKNTKTKTVSSQKQVPKQKLIWNQCNKCNIILQKLNNEDHLVNDCSKLENTINQEFPFLFKNFARLTVVEHSRGF